LVSFGFPVVLAGENPGIALMPRPTVGQLDAHIGFEEIPAVIRVLPGTASLKPVSRPGIRAASKTVGVVARRGLPGVRTYCVGIEVPIRIAIQDEVAAGKISRIRGSLQKANL
jgi:hypothetical protein